MGLKARAALLAFAFAAPARADSDFGTANAVFLRVEQGARATGMGGAFSALADDANSIWWNPAGLARVPVREVFASHTKHIENITTQFGAVAWPVSERIGTFGASFTYLSVPGIDGFDATKQAVSKLTANAFSASLAYGRTVVENLSLGINAKVLGSRLDTERGTGLAFDVGGQYRQSGFGIGFAAQHIGPDFKIGTESETLPRNLRGGVSYSYKDKLSGAVDLERPIDADFRLRVGAEWKATGAFTLRAGWQQTQYLGALAGYTLGLGYVTVLGGQGGWAGDSTPWWEKRSDDQDRPARQEGTYALFFDYGYTAMGDLADIHRFTVGAKF